MNTPLSRNARDLLERARHDAPSTLQRELMWDRVATDVGAAAKGAAATKTMTGVKLLAVGGAIGAVSTALGVVVAVAVVDGPTREAPHPRAPHAYVPNARAPGATLAAASPRVRAEERGPRSSGSRRGEAAEGSEFATEVRLVTDARAALVRGDAEHALSLVRTTHTLRSRSLEPEELGIEARALRALARTDEAAQAELLLRAKYPEHALAR